ncbi:hypothetical protein [Altericista sp. CCNU0014]|uniref:hypothetical protein n=1 Tax=Altericista sp. CCNU0014 TaxID=3082949 RepID=UPI00384D782E
MRTGWQRLDWIWRLGLEELRLLLEAIALAIVHPLAAFKPFQFANLSLASNFYT